MRLNDVSSKVRLSGWVFRKRDHGQLLFIDLRDHYGVTQVVITPERDFFELCQAIKIESVITVTGTVVARSPETVNPNLLTGEVELATETINVESPCKKLPFQVDSDEHFLEELRLRYRYLDLRRERMHRNIIYAQR